MFILLNRCRGTKAIISKFIAVLIAVTLYLITSDLFVSVFTGFGYLLGESMGWGKWIGGIMSGNRLSPTPRQLADEEGRDNGIHWLADSLFPEIENYYRYCIIALIFRGMYWFRLLFLPLVILGYISIPVYLLAVVLLGLGFPASVLLGKWSKDKFTIHTRFCKIEGTWEHAEVWYGIAQDIVITLVLVYLIKGL